MTRSMPAIGRKQNALLITGKRHIQWNRPHLMVQFVDKGHLARWQLKNLKRIGRFKDAWHTVGQADFSRDVADRAIPQARLVRLKGCSSSIVQRRVAAAEHLNFWR